MPNSTGPPMRWLRSLSGVASAEVPLPFGAKSDPATAAAIWNPHAGATAAPLDARMAPAEGMRLALQAGARGLWALPYWGIDALLRRSSPMEDLLLHARRARLVVFTSGSEGERKGVMLSGNNVAASVTASAERLGSGSDDPWLAVLPLFHVGGLSILWRQAAAAAPVVLEPSFDPVRCAAFLPEVAFASVVPTMLLRMLDAGARGGGRLRGVLVGGGPADPALLRRAIDAGIPALQTYGMTETCSQVCTVAPRTPERIWAPPVDRWRVPR